MTPKSMILGGPDPIGSIDSIDDHDDDHDHDHDDHDHDDHDHDDDIMIMNMCAYR